MKISSPYYGVVFGGVCDMDGFCKVELGSYRWGWGDFCKKVFQSNKSWSDAHCCYLLGLLFMTSLYPTYCFVELGHLKI